MRSLHGVLGLLLVVVPGLAASCSGDSTTSGAGASGEGGDAGESAQAGSQSMTGGKNTTGGTGASKGGAGGETGEAGEASGGTNAAIGGQAGAGASAPEGGAGAGDGAAGNGGESGGGAGNGGDGATGGSAAGAGGEASGPGSLGHIVVFDAGPHNGLDFGGRVGLDQHCATAKASGSVPGAVTHALISVSATDEIRDMPALYGVPTNQLLLGPTGKQIADNWADLLDGSIDQSLTDAGISSAQFWISGSNTDGSVRSTCNGWTTSEFSQQITGTYGYPASKDSLWITITQGDVYCSASQYNVICLAY